MKQISADLGIALSTAYKWNALLRARNGAWIRGQPVTKAKRISGMTADHSRQHAISLSLEHPTLSLRKLQRLLEQEHRTKLSVGWLHGILSEVDLSTREQREAVLLARYEQEHSRAAPVLNRKQLRAIEKHDMFATLPFPRPTKKGDTFIHDIIRMRKDFPTGGGKLHLLIDTHDGEALSRFIGSATGLTAAAFLDEALKQSGITPRCIYTDHSVEFVAGKNRAIYQDVTRKHRIQLRHHASTNQRRNPVVQEIWTALRRFLLNEGLQACRDAKDNPDGLNSRIREFLDSKRLQNLSAPLLPR